MHQGNISEVSQRYIWEHKCCSHEFQIAVCLVRLHMGIHKILGSSIVYVRSKLGCLLIAAVKCYNSQWCARVHTCTHRCVRPSPARRMLVYEVQLMHCIDSQPFDMNRSYVDNLPMQMIFTATGSHIFETEKKKRHLSSDLHRLMEYVKC